MKAWPHSRGKMKARNSPFGETFWAVLTIGMRKMSDEKYGDDLMSAER